MKDFIKFIFGIAYGLILAITWFLGHEAIVIMSLGTFIAWTYLDTK